jgi:hypothetical protein
VGRLQPHHYHLFDDGGRLKIAFDSVQWINLVFSWVWDKKYRGREEEKIEALNLFLIVFKNCLVHSCCLFLTVHFYF